MPSKFWTPLAWVALLAACSNTLYPGPRRPRSEVATIETDAIFIDTLDGVYVGTGETVEILPGRHALGIRLQDHERAVMADEVLSAQPIVLCFEARAGRSYLARPAVVGLENWRPEIIDLDRQQVVKSHACGRGERRRPGEGLPGLAQGHSGWSLKKARVPSAISRPNRFATARGLSRRPNSMHSSSD